MTEAEIFQVVDALDPQPLVDETLPIWEKRIDQVGNAELAKVGANVAFDMFNPAVVAHLENYAGNRIPDLINITTRDALRTTLVEGVKAGEGTRELRKRITQVFTDGNLNIYKVRAERIARTEVHRSSNFAIHTAQRQSGLVRKRQWVAALINTRATHAALHGTVKSINEPFTIGLSSAMYPGSFGIAAEDINCQCTVVAVIDKPLQLSIGKQGLDEDEMVVASESYIDLVEPWVVEGRQAFIRGFEIQMMAVLGVFDRLARG